MRVCGVVGDVAVLPCTAASSPAAGCRRSPWDSKLVPFPGAAVLPDSAGRTACCFGKLQTFVGRSTSCSNYHRMRKCVVRAFETFDMNQSVNAPLDLESPSGQLLSQIMQTHPHLLSAAIDQQLETLQADRDAQKDDKPPGSHDPLYKRITEVKEKDRMKSVEEIMYCVVVQKFMDNGIVMIPKMSSSTVPSIIELDSLPNQEQKLESIHSPEELELVQSHIALVLGERHVGPLNSVVQMSKMKLGKLYAASIMYGYFLERVDQRFQLDKTMNTLPPRPVDINNQIIFDERMQQPHPLWDLESMVQIYPEEEGDSSRSGESNQQQYRLRSYVTYLDMDTLQRYATIRSKEAISLIEKQTQALFGRPDIRVADDGRLDVSNDEAVSVTLSGLTMLVLEAVAFGSFLWDAESYVESKYHFVTNS